MDTEERNQLIRTMLDEGLTLAQVQKRLEDEHDISLTYMDLRLISAELDVDWEKQDAQREGSGTIQDVSKAPLPDDGQGAPAGQTQVSVSKVVRPGSVMSGDVTFKSGAEAEWFVDQLGRLGLNPKEGSDKPTEEDMQDFQVKLQEALQGG